MKLGTAGYMSPEQIRGEPLDASTDIFSFGLVLYEMATGERAFTGETEAILHDAIQHREPKPVCELTPTISSRLAEIIEQCLEKEPARRFQTGTELRSALLEVPHASPLVVRPPLEEDKPAASRRVWVAAVLSATLLIAVLAVFMYRRAHPAPNLTDKDTIVLADLENKTGDEVFDGSLTEALRIELEQTPFLNLLSSDKVSRVLKQAGHSGREPLTVESAKEVCARTHSAAVVSGSIEDAGNRYKLDLKATRCDTGAVIATAEAEAHQRNLIIQELGLAAVALRRRLGEPGKTLQGFNQPLEIATTSSVEALRAFTLGQQQHLMGDEAKASEYFRRAVETDDNFAFAFDRLGSSMSNLSDDDRSKEVERKAYALRDRLTRQQRLFMEGRYFEMATGDLEKATAAWEEMLRVYPDSTIAHNNLSFIYRVLGHYEQSAAEAREAIRLNADNFAPYYNLMYSETAMERSVEAKAALKAARARGLDNELLRDARFQLAFLERDDSAMQEQLKWGLEHPSSWRLRWEQARTDAYFGHLKKAKGTVDDLTGVAERAGQTERAGSHISGWALLQAEVGNTKLAKEEATQALALHSGSEVRWLAATALARSGEWRPAEEVTAQLDAEMPQNTLAQHQQLPCLQAAIAISQGNAPEAVQVLETQVRYELAPGALYPAYVQGLAYLGIRKGSAAAAQFRTIIDHPGIVVNEMWGALAHLQLARAYAMMGDKEAARKSYQDFLTLWKDADPDIPIYKQAKAEYKKLNQPPATSRQLPAKSHQLSAVSHQ